MRSLYKTSKIVHDILVDIPATRSSDNLLYLEVLKAIDDRIPRLSFMTVMEHISEYNLPPFESVRRSRQKIQHDHAELRATDKVESFRAINEQEYKEFARY